MLRCRFFLLLLAFGVLAAPASAGIFSSKHTKPNPAERVPELLAILKNDLDEHKRTAAAEELRQYDAAAFPDMIPALIEVVLHDPKPGVRTEAADTLGKLRPVTQQAGKALEQALSNDASMRVRLQARYSLLTYHWSGYHSGKKTEPTASLTGEPPPVMPMEKSVVKPSSTSGPRLAPVPAASKGPLPPAVDTQAPLSVGGMLRSIWTTSSKVAPPVVEPVPAKNSPVKTTKSSDEGPELIPPG